MQQAATSAKELFRLKAKAKIKKHTYYSADEHGDRMFVAMVVTTMGGIGPASFWRWFDGAFQRAVATDIALGSTGRSALQRKSMALQRAQSALAKANANMIAKLAR